MRETAERRVRKKGSGIHNVLLRTERRLRTSQQDDAAPKPAAHHTPEPSSLPTSGRSPNRRSGSSVSRLFASLRKFSLSTSLLCSPFSHSHDLFSSPATASPRFCSYIHFKFTRLRNIKYALVR